MADDASLEKGRPQTAKMGSKELSKIGTFQEIVIPFSENDRPTTELPEALTSTTAQVVLVQDVHSDHRIRSALSYSIAKRLNQQGFKYYLVEAPKRRQELFNQLGKGRVVDLYGKRFIGPQSFGDRSFADAVYAMSGSGMKVHAVDHDMNYPSDKPTQLSAEKREEHIFSETKEAIGKDRAICLIGSEHAQLGNIKDDAPTLAQRLVNNGYSVASIRFSNQ